MEERDPSQFGVLLRRFRVDAGLSQEELAERALISARAISDLERGVNRTARRDTVRRLIEALDLSPEQRTEIEAASRPRREGIEPAEPAADSQLARIHTFLIVDIRGYSRFTEERGDEAGAELAAHFAQLVERAVSPRQGRLLELRGDEALVVFSSTRQALRGAVELQARFDEAFGQTLALHVGIGLDAGEAVGTKGGYRGRALNLAARLCALAGRGAAGQSEAFCSETVVTLAGTMEGVVWVDRGAVRLKGLADPVRVLQVGREGALPAALPPLQSASIERSTNLPNEPTPFIGREQEVVAIIDLLRQEGVRLLTLTGPGGTGKTRLAIRVAHGLADAFPDGVVFVPLAALTDPALVTPTVAVAVEVKESPGQPLVDALQSHLRQKRLLLILDNFEHLLSAASLVSELLAACPVLTVLATSRAVLHVAAEHVYAVPPLAVPDAGHGPSLETLLRYDAVALFVERARAAKADFSVDEENAPAVVEICQWLDGLPLAIELAAARTRLFPPQALLHRLSNRLQLLTGGARDVPARQQTLRNTIDWSHSLLSNDAKTLFRRLSVFEGGFTAEAAEAVCSEGGDGQGEVLAGLESLVDQSLLIVEERAPGGYPEPRFRMLETIREYALERLTGSGEIAEMRRRHAEAFLRLAEDPGREGASAERAVWLAHLDTEIDNLRAALAWSTRQEGSAEIALQLAAALVPFWTGNRYWSEGRRWLERSLAVSASSHGAEKYPRAWAQAVTGLGDLAARMGDFATARTYAEQGVAIWRTLDDKHGLASALVALQWVMRRQGDHLQARPLLDELLALSRDTGNVHTTVLTLHFLAQAEAQRGNLAAARSQIEEAVDLSRQIGHTLEVVYGLCDLAEVAWAQGDTSAPRNYYDEALTGTRALKDPADVLTVLRKLSWLALRLGEYERATDLLTEKLALARGQPRTVQDWWGIAWTLNHLGDVARCQGDVGRAMSLYEESLTLFRQHGERQGIAAVLHNLGHVALSQGDARRARSLFMESLSLFRELDFAWSIADCVMGLAGVAGQEGHPRQAALLYGAAEAAHEAIDASGLLIDPANATVWEREMAAARDQIDAETWEQAWGAGRAMSIDQALARADRANE